jgi:glycosyltransferase involved in cell wall biosynthesis
MIKKTIWLLYPYPWFNKRFYHKDVIQFPKSLATQVGGEFHINRGLLVTGSEREGQSVALIRFALIVNTVHCLIRLVFNAKDIRNSFYVVQFHISWVTALNCLALRFFFKGRCKVIVKTDLNLCGSLGRKCPTRSEKIALQVIDRTATAVTGESEAAVEILKQYFTSKKIFLQYNGVDLQSFTGDKGSSIDRNRDIDVMVVSRFDVPEKGVDYYKIVVPILVKRGIKIALVGQAVSKVFPGNGLTDKKTLIQHESLAHNEVIQLMRRSKILLNLSISESYIIALVEAVSVGCFVVATKAGVAPDLAAKYKSVVLCDFDPDEIVSNVLNIIYNSGSYPDPVSDWYWPKLIADSGINRIFADEYSS